MQPKANILQADAVILPKQENAAQQQANGVIGLRVHRPARLAPVHSVGTEAFVYLKPQYL